MQNLVSFRSITLGLSAIASLLIGFVLFDADGAITFVGRFGYWLLFATVALLLIELARILYSAQQANDWLSIDGIRARITNLKGKHLLRLLPIALVTIVTLKSQPWQFKFVMDEPVLMATAKQMHLNKEAYSAGAQYQIGGVTYNNSIFVDKRPLLYPFLVSVLHDWTGYRIYQGIVLNAILLLALNTLIYQWGKVLCPPLGGYIILLLFNSIPLLGVNATSSGFDVLNLLLLAGLPALLYWHLKRLTPYTLNCLLIYTVLLAQARYESVLFIVPTACAILYSWWKAKEVMITKTMLVVPLLLVTYPLQRTIMNSDNAFWQVPEGIDSPFGIQFLSNNLGHVIDFLFVYDRSTPNSLLLTAFWVLALCGLILSILKRGARLQLNPMQFASALGVALIVVANFALLMLYHWGHIDDPIATRLILPTLLLMAMFVVFVFGTFKSQARLQIVATIICTCYFVLVTRPAMAKTDFLDFTIRNAQADYLVGEALSQEDRDILIISDRNLSSNLGDDSSISIDVALARLPQLELHKRLRTFDEIQVVYLLPTKGANQELVQIEEIVATRDAIEESFEMEVIATKKLNNGVYLRHAKLLDVRLRDGESLLDFDMSSMRIRYNGKIEFLDETLPKQFTESLPK